MLRQLLKITPFVQNLYSVCSSVRPTILLLIYLLQEEMKKEFVEITLPAQLQNLEAILKDHNEGKGFFLGDKVSGSELLLARNSLYPYVLHLRVTR